jgi:L-arabinose isomerase
MKNLKNLELCQDEPLPKLPVARAVWKPQPDFKISSASWISSGGSHHRALSKALDGEVIEDFASISGIEFLHIDQDSMVSEERKELRNNEAYYYLNKGFTVAG